MSSKIQTAPLLSTHPSINPKRDAVLNVELDVEKRLTSQIARDGIRVKEFFIDFDRLRKGHVKEAAFRTCLGTLGFRFTEDEIQQLIQKYRIQGTNDLINYFAFCDNINTVFSDKVDPLDAINASKSKALFSEQEQDIMRQTLNDLRKIVLQNRILLKPQFQDYDRSQSSHITAAQFLRVLKNLDLMPNSEVVFDLMIRKYCDKGNTREVNYYNFCKDVDRPEDMFPPYVAKHPLKEPGLPHQEMKQSKTFFENSTKGLDVISNRYLQQRVEIANDPSDVEQRLQHLIVMKRVRVEEFFRDFDKLRKGKVTKGQFKTIFSQLNLDLTEFEYDGLFQKYKTDDPEDMFNYAAFCANINAAFTTYGVQKDPNVRVQPVTQQNTVLARRKYLESSEEESAQNERLLDEYRTAINNKRLSLKPQFQDFDITKNGHVTKMQFMRVLAQLRISVPDELMNCLLKRYMDKGNVDEVNYVDFCNEIDSPVQVFGVGRDFNHSYNYYPKTQPKPVETDILKHNPQDIEDVIARIRSTCLQQRIRIGEFFRDFDKLRSGFITSAQFRIGLNMAKVVLSAAEFKQLCEHFKAPKEGEHVTWREFSDQIDEVFTKKHLEQSVDTILGDARTQTFYFREKPQSEDHDQVQGVIERFKLLIQRQRLDAKSFFQDFDKHKHFKVSPKQFKQVLNGFGFNLTDRELKAIVLIYGNEQNDVQYLDFINDTQVLKYTIYGPTSGAKSTYVETNLDFTGTKQTEALMKKVKEMVKKDRLRLGEFFIDHDQLRKGYVAEQKFRSVLHSQKLQLTTEEYKLLEDHFRCENDPTKVNYVRFNEEIEGIFTQKDLEKNPTKTLNAFKAPSILDPKNQLSESEEQDLDACLKRIGTDVRHRRLLIKPFFQDKDKSNSGFIANTRFRSIFDNMKILVSEHEFDLINKRFQAKAANEINYVEFDWVLRHYSGDHEPI